MKLSTKINNDKVKVGIGIIFYAFLLIGFGIFFSGCGTLTQEDIEREEGEDGRLLK